MIKYLKTVFYLNERKRKLIPNTNTTFSFPEKWDNKICSLMVAFYNAETFHQLFFHLSLLSFPWIK